MLLDSMKYYFDRERQTLVATSVKQLVVQINADESLSIVKTIVKDGDNLKELPADVKFYKDEDHFRGCITIKKPVKLDDLLKKVAFGGAMPITDDEKGRYYLIMKDGTPKRKYVKELEGFNVFDDDSVSIVTPIEQTLYGSKETLFRCESYNVQDEEGNQITREGILEKAKLTDEQKQLCEELSRVIERLEQNGLKLCYDREDCSFFAANNNMQFSYENPENWNGDETYENVTNDIFNYCYDNSSRQFLFGLGSMDYFGCDDKIWIRSNQ